MTNAESGEVVRGRPLDENEQALLAASDEYFAAPKSLERIEGKVGFVFSSTALVGSLAAGLGLLNSDGGVATAHPTLTGVAAALLAIAIILALIANLPWVWNIPPRRLDRVKRFFDRSVAIRGWLVVGALASFSAAIVVALALLITSTQAGPTATCGIGWSRDDKDLAVSCTATVRHLSASSRIEVTVFGVPASGQKQAIAREVHRSGTESTLTISTSATRKPPYPEYAIAVTIASPGNGPGSCSQTLAVS